MLRTTASKTYFMVNCAVSCSPVVLVQYCKWSRRISHPVMFFAPNAMAGVFFPAAHGEYDIFGLVMIR